MKAQLLIKKNTKLLSQNLINLNLLEARDKIKHAIFNNNSRRIAECCVKILNININQIFTIKIMERILI